MKKLRTQRVLQEGFITFFEIIKAILMGIVEGITEWLPISSTGHMILVEQVVKVNASEEFMSMFRVVIQLGAILAVVVLFWNKLWPFGLRQGKVISKPSVWNLWFKVVAATLPVLVISPLDDWMEAHFYNYITVATPARTFGNVSADTWGTSKVRAALLGVNAATQARTKIVTYDNVTYVMGLLTPEEQALITQKVSTTIGVQKVVTLYQNYVAQ